MRKPKPRIWVLILVLAVIGSNAPVATAAIRRMLHTNEIHSQEYMAKHGRWDVMEYKSPVRAVHAAVLPDGNVWLAAGSGNNAFDFSAGTYKTSVWNPKDGTFQEVNTPWDLFCAGHAYMTDGNILVAGGTAGYEDLERNIPFKGLPDTFVFNTKDYTYTRVDSMRDGRWYPTLTTMGNGNIMAVAGLDSNGKEVKGTVEVYDPARKQWFPRDDIKQWFPTYPQFSLMANGNIFYSGQGAGYAFDEHRPAVWAPTRGNTYLDVANLPDKDVRDYGGTVLLPPAQRQRVMTMGGGTPGGGANDPSTASTAIADLTLQNPRWSPGPDLPTAKRYVNTTILPDWTVFVNGGSRFYRDGDILEAHVYDPEENVFREMAEPTVGRNYHSNSLLLPDGSVASVGSNPLKDNFFEMRIEVYKPPYFFQGTRPKITAGPAEASYGDVIQVEATTEAPIKSFALIRASTTTHQLNTDQRLVNVPFEDNGDGTYSLRIEDDPNVAVPGPYMLFALDDQGRPSEAHWVNVGHEGGLPTTVPGSTLVDGTRPFDPLYPPPGMTPEEIAEATAELEAEQGPIDLEEAQEDAEGAAADAAEAAGAGEAPVDAGDGAEEEAPDAPADAPADDPADGAGAPGPEPGVVPAAPGADPAGAGATASRTRRRPGRPGSPPRPPARTPSRSPRPARRAALPWRPPGAGLTHRRSGGRPR